MIKYTIGGFRQFNLDWVGELKNNKHIILSDKIEIDSFHDSFNNVIWNSGAIKIGPVQSIAEVERTVEKINNLGIGMNFTFSNSLITKEHLSDHYANKILEIAHNKMNGVILTSEILRDYIEKNYPNYKIISSITNVTLDKEWLKRQFDDYDRIVIPVEYNHDLDLLDSLPQKEKIEILINEACVPNCKYKKEHYKATSEDQLNFIDYGRDSETTRVFNEHCPLVASRKNNNFDDVAHKTNVSFKEIEILNSMGIENFKIMGRVAPISLILRDLLRYFIKPEYRNDVKNKYKQYLS